MAKIPFSIDKRPEIEAGKLRVMTGDGYPARIVCWDFKGDGPLLVAVMENGIELTRTYEENGFYVKGGTTLDLFLITPEPELSEFEEAVGAEIFDPPFNTEQVKVIKEESAKLLSLARKEIIGEWSKGLRDTQDLSGKAYNDGYNLGFEIGYDKGKAEALKDRPTWKKCEDGNTDRLELEALCREAGSPIEIAFRANGYRIFLSDLEVLPKEDQQ